LLLDPLSQLNQVLTTEVVLASFKKNLFLLKLWQALNAGFVGLVFEPAFERIGNVVIVIGRCVGLALRGGFIHGVRSK